MDFQNAFLEKPAAPTPGELETALGASADAWKELVDWLKAVQGVDEQEWQSLSPKYGWSLRLKRKKRTIVYLGPCDGCFRVALVLGDRAVAAARKSGLPKSVLRTIEQAPRYAEGTGIRLMVKGEQDLAPIRKLASIKLAN